MLIVIEGADGSGKDTVANELGLPTQNFPDRTTPTGKMLDRMLKEGVQAPLVFQSLQLTNRMELLHRLVEAKGQRHKHLVCIRYWQSGWVYGQLDGLDPAWLIDIHRALPQPDLNVLLDVPPETIQARRQARGGTAENYEKVELDAKVIELYRRLWDTYGWQRFLPKDDPAEWIMTWLRAGR